MLKMLRAGIADLREARRAQSDRLWDIVDRFERDCSHDWELWHALPEETQQLYREGARLFGKDKAAGRARLEEAATLGDPIAMIQVAKCYWHGTGTAMDRDKAERLFVEARMAGSRQAAIELAILASRKGDMETCFAILEDGVAADDTGAMFWLAWYRYRERPSRRTAREILPLLETALERGHPGARWLMARLMFRGKLGLGRIAEGLRMARALWRDLQEDTAGGERSSGG